MLAEHYGDLRALAERQLLAARLQGGSTTLSPTSLLGETFTRLLRQETKIQDQSHLAAIATMLFVRILADTRRRRLARKRGGRNHAGSLDGQDVADTKPTPDQDALLDADVEFLHEKLAELAEREPELAAELARFRDEELAHRDLAIEEGAQEAPGYALLSAVIRAGCRTAIRISEKV